MSEYDVIKSRPFDAPFVRVRGRLSRQGGVVWSPCLRTFHPPDWVKDASEGEQPLEPAVSPTGILSETTRTPRGGVPNPHYREMVDAQQDMPTSNPPVPGGPGGESTSAVSTGSSAYVIAFEDAQGKVLVRAPVRIRFFAHDRQRALFTQRLPYHRDTRRVVLARHERELGALTVPTRVPEFLLITPTKSEDIDAKGVLHLRWELDAAEEEHSKKYPLIYYVRYTANRKQWYRPGVNIRATSFDLDLREMPGGDRCVAEVIATNGYQTSYVETPHFAVPRKAPEILLATPRGPLLFAQGFSREDGPLVGESVVWIADRKRPVGTGASFDARKLGGRIHQLAVQVTDSTGAVTIQYLGWYDGKTGQQVRSAPGL